MGKTIGVISIKGGVGKTSTVVALGAVLTHDFGQKVLLVDANFSAPNLGIHLGIVKPDVTIHDVINGKAKIQDAIYEYDGIHVLPARVPPTKINKMNNFSAKLETLKPFYDIILIDSSPSMHEELLAAMTASDEILVVTTPDYPTLSCTIYATQIALKKNTPIVGIVLNKVRNKKFEVPIEEVEHCAGASVLAMLPDDVNILAALANHIPSTSFSPKSNSTIEYKKLAATLIKKTYRDERWKTKIKAVFHKVPNRCEINRSRIVDRIEF
ncbi:MAG: AAA family ATPase [archaeon]